jgi:Tol biopolymer transport system component
MSLGPNGQITEQVRLTTNAAEDGGSVVFPDGKRIAFTSKRDGDYDVYLMKASPEGRRSTPVNLSRNPADDTSPTWSPDGRKVTFNSNRSGSDDTTDVDIWRMRATDGANPTNLTDNAGVDFDPGWQPLP